MLYHTPEGKHGIVMYIPPYQQGELSPAHPCLQLLGCLQYYDRELTANANFYREHPEVLSKYNYHRGIWGERLLGEYDPTRVDRIQFLAGTDPKTMWMIEMQLRQPKGAERCLVKAAYFVQIERSTFTEVWQDILRTYWLSGYSESHIPGRKPKTWAPGAGYAALAFGRIMFDSKGRIIHVFSAKTESTTQAAESRGMKFDREYLERVLEPSDQIDPPSSLGSLDNLLKDFPLQEH